MKGRLLAVLLILLIALARPDRELEHVELVQVLGVDGSGPVTLTALGDGEEPARWTVTGADPREAQEALKDVGSRRLELTHVSRLVLGPDADGYRTLYQEILNRKSGYGATVWYCAEGAEGLLTGCKDPAGRLKSLEENAGVRAPTVLAALRSLSEEGQAELPVARVSDGELEMAGYYTMKGDMGGGG